ncbi:MAG: DNA primase, partial [Victivallales bacterium]|nr:DNA primase [Victivallales bacterium]
PSFTVSEARGRYHCFGCGAGGDVFRFVMDWEKVDFPNAVHLLAAKCGVVIPEKTYDDPKERQQAKQRAGRRERLYQINQEFAEWYALLLKNQPESPVGTYLAGRGIPTEITQKFQLGAAPDSWDASLIYGRERGFSDEEMLESGIVLRHEEKKSIYDRFRGRLIFPIWNEQGRVVGFSARTLAAEAPGAKYVNSPETPVFRKSNILYALPLARKAIQDKNMAILCEGQLDTIAMHRAGFECAVAPQGTAFTDEQARILKRYTDRIYLAFDSDAAGRKATARAIELLLPLDFEVKVMRFPEGSDPDEIYKNSGEAGLTRLVTEAVDMFGFLGDTVFVRHDSRTPFGKSRIIAEMLNYFALMSNSVAREAYIRELSTRLGVNPEAIFAEYNKFRRKHNDGFKFRRNPEAISELQNAQSPELPPPVAAAREHAEQTLLEIALTSAEIAGSLANGLLPPEKLSPTPVGKALNELINCTLNGEWEHVHEHLSDFERENPSPELSRILFEELPSLTGEAMHKSVKDCLAAINSHDTKNKMAVLMRKLGSASAEEKKDILREMHELNKNTAAGA